MLSHCSVKVYRINREMEDNFQTFVQIQIKEEKTLVTRSFIPHHFVGIEHDKFPCEIIHS